MGVGVGTVTQSTPHARRAQSGVLHGADARLAVARQCLHGFLDVVSEALGGNVPDLDRGVVRARRELVLVERVPRRVEDSTLVVSSSFGEGVSKGTLKGPTINPSLNPGGENAHLRGGGRGWW